MVETPNRQLNQPQAAAAPSSTAEAKAAIRETRARLAVRLTGTADRVNAIFGQPTVVETDRRDAGFVSAIVSAFAAAGEAKRAWREARNTGILSRAAVATVAAGIALAIATKTTSGRARR